MHSTNIKALVVGLVCSLCIVSFSEAASIERSGFSASATEIDFDTLPEGGLSTELSSLGIVFANTKVIARDWAPSQPNQIEPAGSGALRATFAPEVPRVGMTIDTDALNPPVSLRAYDAQGTLLDTVLFAAPGDFAGIEILSGISYVEFGPSDGYDNLVFDQPGMPVPSVSTWALMTGVFLMAAAGTLLIRRRGFCLFRTV